MVENFLNSLATNSVSIMLVYKVLVMYAELCHLLWATFSPTLGLVYYHEGIHKQVERDILHVFFVSASPFSTLRVSYSLIHNRKQHLTLYFVHCVRPMGTAARV